MGIYKSGTAEKQRVHGTMSHQYVASKYVFN